MYLSICSQALPPSLYFSICSVPQDLTFLWVPAGRSTVLILEGNKLTGKLPQRLPGLLSFLDVLLEQLEVHLGTHNESESAVYCCLLLGRS